MYEHNSLLFIGALTLECLRGVLREYILAAKCGDQQQPGGQRFTVHGYYKYCEGERDTTNSKGLNKMSVRRA
jgi:hypothetical protein